LLEPLTRRELEVLDLLAGGLTSKEIAERLTLAVSSVRWYVQQIYGKLGVNGKRQAITQASELGLIHLAPSNFFSLPRTGQPAPQPRWTFHTGTITFLFTEIEGSTPSWEKMPGSMDAAIKLHHAILREVVAANHGAVYKVMGDVFHASFPLALEGLSAAIEIQRRLANSVLPEGVGSLKLRMGLHTGPASLDERGDYEDSSTLNRAALVMSTGYGGQILLSQEARDLVERSMPPSVKLKDLGEHHLKDLGIPEHLYQVMAPGLVEDFPPLASSIQTSNNLPNQVSSFIGRETEIKDLMGLISQHRLVTLIGSGGTGKTRLSLRVAEEMLSRFSDGVWLVELAHISNSDRLLPVVASTFGLQETADMPIRDISLNYLKNRSLLLILDNCEHMIAACAEMADLLLHSCSKLTLLATSREALRVDGEIVYRVPSLSLPDPLALPPLDELLHFEAICLFVERALAFHKGFQLTNRNASVVIQLCRRLDGIPLALELAAARLSMMSLEQVYTRLDDCFRLLTTGLRTALPRHQTIRASIEWSYNLLNEKERLLLRRLSIFSGSWTLEAAEEVCGFDGIEDFEVLELLASLVGKSLVSMVEAPSRTWNFMAGRQDRYRMLETIRQYAANQLVSEIVTKNNAIEELRERHLDYFAQLAGQMESGLQGHDQSVWVDFITSELDNIRSVLDWAMGPSHVGNPKKGLELVNGLMWFWWYFGHAKDTLTWLDVGLPRLLQQADPPKLHIARTYKTVAVMFYLVSDYSKSISYFERSIALFRPMGPSVDLAEALCIYALVLHQDGNDPARALAEVTEAIEVSGYTSDLNIQALGPFVKGIIIQQADMQGARTSLEESLGIFNKVGNELMADNVIRILGSTAIFEGDLDLARNYLQTGLSISQKYQAKQHLTWDLSSLGDLAYFEGDFARMENYFLECLAKGEEIGFRRPMVWSIHHLGVAARRQGRLEQSEERFHNSLALAKEYGFEELVFENLAGLAGILLEHGRIAQAASLLGMVEAHGLEMLGPIAQVEFERDRARAQERLPEAEFRFAWEEGRMTTLAQALENSGKAKA
jgi:predicted ATPase/class 3 adenylate cyclase/DNA-binding CsgD family transcriptional regulator